MLPPPRDVAEGDSRCLRAGIGGAIGLTVLAALQGACGSQDPAAAREVLAVEASFGGSWCHRIEDPAVVAELSTERRALDGNWRAAWTPLPEASLELVFVGASEELGRLGIGDGQAQTTQDGRQVFQPIANETAARFVSLAGGPPLGPPDRPCASPTPEPAPANQGADSTNETARETLPGLARETDRGLARET